MPVVFNRLYNHNTINSLRHYLTENIPAYYQIRIITKLIRFAIVIALLLGTPLFVFGQWVFTDTGKETSLEEIKKMFTEAKKIYFSKISNSVNADLHILEIKDEKYLLFTGYLDVYHWENAHWVNIYNGNLSGYNFGSKKFVSNNKIYSYGGYGFWNLHGELIVFDNEKGDWDIMSCTRKLPGGIGILQEDNQKIQVYSEGQTFSIDIPECKISSNAKPVHKVIDNLSRAGGTFANTYETDSFFLMDKGSFQYLFTKKNLKVYENATGLGKLEQMNDYNYYVQIRGNDFRIIDTLDGTVDTFTQAEVYQLFNVQDDNSLEDLEAASSFPYAWSVLILIVSLGGIIAGYRVRRKRTTKAPLPPEHPIISRFKAFSGQQITTEHLDEILEIQHIKLNETLRYRRAQLIKQINQIHEQSYREPLIIRIQDPEDGRKFLYKIY
jgi:hypothetical protein